MTPDRPCSAAPRRTPTSSSRRARPATRSTTPARPSCRRSMDKFAAIGGPPVPPVRLRGRARRRARDRGDGLRRRVAQETVEYLVAAGEKVGVVKVRLYRPFSIEHFIAALPKPRSRPSPSSTAPRSRAPRRAALPGRGHRHRRVRQTATPFKPCPKVVGGRYGLSSKEFTPAMVKAVFDEFKKPAPRTTSPSASSTT
jgi:pyruvate-ferredoxin/flavodoxin oxidoreductase